MKNTFYTFLCAVSLLSLACNAIDQHKIDMWCKSFHLNDTQLPLLKTYLVDVQYFAQQSIPNPHYQDTTEGKKLIQKIDRDIEILSTDKELCKIFKALVILIQEELSQSGGADYYIALYNIITSCLFCLPYKISNV